MPVPGAGLLQRERARIRGFFGLNLPERDIDLRFDLLPFARGGRKPPLTEDKLRAHLQAHRATPKEFLEAGLAVARDLNRYPMSDKRRMAMTDALAYAIYAEIAQAVKEITKQEGGIPEQAGRQRMLELFENCVSALTESYQLLFAAGYGRGRFWYARIRPRVYRSACRIMELIKLHHRIVGLRYMPLPSKATRTANTVFVAMRACEPVDFPIDALSERSHAIDARGTASLSQHYASLLTYPLLDYSAWPEQEQFFIDTYCNAIPDAIRFHDYDPKAPTKAPIEAPPVAPEKVSEQAPNKAMPKAQTQRKPSGTSPSGTRKDQFLVGCYQDSPPARKLPRQAQIGPALVIDYSTLALSIRKDYAELSRARTDRNHFAMPPRLARLEPVYQTATGYLLHHNLALPHKWGDISSSRQRHRDLRIYTGFEEVRSHLLAIFRGGSKMQRSRELSNLFAKRSAVIGEDDSSTRESLWYLLYDSEQQMRIKTQETRFTNRMFIGNLLAYGFGAAEVIKPRIGKVNRIFRPESGTVIIDIEYLASFATPIALHKRNPAAETDSGKIKVVGKPLAALLIYHPTRGWGVITPPQDNFWEKTPVGIQTGKRVTLGELAEAQDVTNEFHWFQVASASFPSKAPAYPVPKDSTETLGISDVPDFV